MHTDKIMTAFNRAASSYDDHCSVQDKVCHQLITYLQAVSPSTEKIVDYACGTGVSTEHLIKNFSYRSLVAVDISEKLLYQARLKLSDFSITFLHASFDDALFKKDSIDLAFANMGLQWSENLASTLSIIASQLKHHGILAFSIPLSGTLREIDLTSKNTFFKLQEVEVFLRQGKLKIMFSDQKTLIENYDSPLEALRSLKKIGAHCVLDWNKKAGLSKRLPIQCAQLTYEIGYFIAQKISR